MKRLVKKLLASVLAAAVICAASFLFEPSSAVLAIAATARAEETAAVTRAPFIEWIYKMIDGKLYRRQFNHVTQEWIGEWELVG